jgi:hypothetical protein
MVTPFKSTSTASCLITNRDYWDLVYRKKFDEFPFDGYYHINDYREKYAKVHANFQYLADMGRLRVNRYSNCKKGEWGHTTEILNARGEVMVFTNGSLKGEDVYIGKWDKKYVEKTEYIPNTTNIRISLMVNEYFPKFPEFCDDDGKRIYLGYNAENNFQLFNITIDQAFVSDEF